MKHFPIILPLLLVVVTFAGACRTTQRQTDVTKPATGLDLINAMHARYADTWYERLRVRQKVVFHDDTGEPQREEVWTELISLPGKVRSIVGDEADGNGEIYVNGAFHIIRDGEVVQRGEQAHPVLLIGYDVYRQEPDETIRTLEAAGFDLATMHETTWNDKRAYVIGGAEDDDAASRFWIDAERLLCLRIVTRSPRGSLYDIRFTKYEVFAGVWLCTELIFRRDGKLLISEYDLEHSVPESIDPAVFEIPPYAADGS